MQGNNYGLLTVRLIELPFTLQHDREIVMFRFYFPLFIKLCMILLCVIFKSEWYLRAVFWVFLHEMFMFDWKQPVQQWKLREELLTINKISLTRWNMYRDNNFHSRREVLRVKCLRKSWVRQAEAYLCFKPASRCSLFFKMNSRQENRSELSVYSQNHN